MRNTNHLVITICLLVTLFYEVTAQDSLSILIDRAYDTQNPNTSLQILSNVVLNDDLADTLLNRYYFTKGVAYGQLGKADSSIFFLEKCIDHALEVNDDYNLMRAYNSMGVLLRIQGQHDSSLESFQNAEKIIVKHSNTERFAKHKSDVLGNIGGIFYQLKDYSSAKRYSTSALEIAKHYNDTSELAYGYLRLAIVAQAQDSLRESLDYNQQASLFLETFGDFNTLSFVENNLGNIYKDQKDFEQALLHHKKANEYAEILGEEAVKAHTLLSIGESYFQLNNLTKSFENAINGLRIAEEGNFPIHTKNAHDLLYKIAVEERDFEKALEERNAYLIVNDSLNTADAQERLAEVETKYETEKKEAEIGRLELDNELQELQLSKTRNQLIGTGIIALLIIGGGIVFVGLRNKRIKAERIAQEHQMDALKQRLLELQMESSSMQLTYNLEDLNDKLHTPLTEREHDALALSLEGKLNKEIADELFVSVNTVKFHLRNIYQKLGVTNKKEAKAYVAKST